MRKIALFIMTLMMAGSLFAYEPKKEFFTVRDDRIYYNEEVGPQYDGDGIRRFLTTGPISMEREAHNLYAMLEIERSLARFYSSFAKREADEEKRKEYINASVNCINRAINEIPFITNEYYWTVNEYQYTKMFCKYLNKIQKAELKRQKQNRK